MIFLDTTCDPVQLEDAHLNSLSWADDLVLFSRTLEGLQTRINKLELYCDTWELEVNVTKAKVMVMLAGKTQIQGITFRGQELECVHSYKYLGLVLSSEGSMKKMEVVRVTKAKRASFALRPPLNIKVFPVHRPGALKRADWNFFFHIFKKYSFFFLLYPPVHSSI